MKILLILFCSCLFVQADTLSIKAVSGSDGRVVLIGPDARRQLVVTNTNAGGEIDVTRGTVYKSEPGGVVEISSTGQVTPLADGMATVSAKLGELVATVSIQVEQAGTPQPINFANEIVPIFTKHGCNGGGCHGKSGGQNSFRLSLLGFEPQEDFEYLVHEGRGRRLFPAAPEYSLLLRKAIGDMPHGGGGRIERGSWDYKAIVRWIEQGMPYGKADDPVVDRIEVFPKSRIVQPGAEQQLAVKAIYNDGSVRDITGTAGYESNFKEMAEAEQGGQVKIGEGQTGDVAVMVRFQEHVDVFQATIPLGAPLGEFPPERNFIDTHAFAKLRTLGLPPSDICDDETFLRRTAIDISGRMPTPGESLAFAADTDPDKRSKWIDALLAGTDYADYFANKWSGLLRNKRTRDHYVRGTQGLYDWIRDSLYRNVPYTEFASELVSAKGTITANPPSAWFRNVDKKEEQLQDVAQMFLGVRLQCAQCHHHPYEKWSQDDYYGFAAFFSRVGKKKTDRPNEDAVYHLVGNASAKNPKNGRDMKPKPLGMDELALAPEADPRESLAEWMTKAENPFFARMLVNRYWKHFFNRALVEPEDDMRVTNPPTNPALLDALEKNFVASGFDLKELIRAICNSSTYQLSATPNDHNQNDRQNYSRYFPKRLGAEVLLDAVDTLTGAPTKFAGQLEGTRAVQLPDDSFNSASYFLTVFGRPAMDSACECERAAGASLAQTLHLLNSKGIQDKLTAGGATAQRLANDSIRDDVAKIGELYRLAFSRQPTGYEISTATGYIAKKKEGAADEKAALKEAYEDVIWALINTKEFLFNH